MTDTDQTVRLVVGLGIMAISLAVAGRRVLFLFKLISSGQPSPGRLKGVNKRIALQFVEVFGQKRLLKWSVPGAAHAVTFWAFIILTLTIIEAIGALFDAHFAIPLIGHWRIVGFVEDLIGTLLLISLATFAYIRRTNDPAKIERSSRFYGSHTRPAWLVLGMISLVACRCLMTVPGSRSPPILSQTRSLPSGVL